MITVTPSSIALKYRDSGYITYLALLCYRNQFVSDALQLGNARDLLVVSHAAMQILGTRASKRCSTTITTHMLSQMQMRLQMLSHIGNVAVLIRAVGTCVPLVGSRVLVRTKITVHTILVAMIHCVLHALVAVGTHHIL